MTASNLYLPANEWVDVYNAYGIPVGTQLYLQVLSTSTGLPVQVYTGASVADASYNTVPVGEWFTIESGVAGAFVRCPVSAWVNVRLVPLTSPSLDGVAISTSLGYIQSSAALTNAEQFALRGYLYHVHFDVTLAAGAAQYISLVVGPGRTVQILNRDLSSNLSGVSFSLLQGTIATAADAVTPYSPVGSSQLSTSTFSLLNTPTTVGAVFDIPIFIGAGSGGVGNAQAGTTGGETGYSIRRAGSSTFGRINNLSAGSNRIILRITYAEYPS